jgi:tetratricopeptide (TPR) repeat protein
MKYSRFGFSQSWIDSAIKVSKEAIEIDPTSSEAHKALGTAYSVKDRSTLAIEEYKKAIELNPGSYMAVGNLGYRYLKIGHLKKALECNMKKIELNPIFGGGYIQLGLVYNSLCEDLKAKLAFKKALELDPKSIWARRGLIALYLAQNNYNEALATAKEILELTSDSLNAFTFAGYIEHARNNSSEAYNYFTSSIKKLEEKYFYHYQIVSMVHLGSILWEKGDKEKAKKLFSDFLDYANKEIDSGNESWEIRYNIAGIHAVMGELDKAFIWLDRAVEAGWRDYRIGMIEPLFKNLGEDNRFEKRIEQVKELVTKAREQIKAAQNL